jgi:hypothetical protein
VLNIRASVGDPTGETMTVTAGSSSNHQPHIEFAFLMREVASRLLGKPNKKLSNGKDLRFGTHGSMSIDIKAGVFFDHENNLGGGVLDLIALKRGGNKEDAVEWLRQEKLLPETEPRKISAIYDYVDEKGALLFQVLRYTPKGFNQRRPDGKGGWTWELGDVRRVLFQLPEVIAAVPAGKTIYICEGEKDCLNLRELGLVATTNPGGANKWRREYSETLRGGDVVVTGDNDSAGRDHVAQVAASLSGIAQRIRVLDLAKHWAECGEGGDISNWLEAGGAVDQLTTFIDALPEYIHQSDNGNGKDDSAIKVRAEPLHSWDDPDISLLDDRRGDLPDFPLHVFSDKLQEVIKRNAKGAGVTPAHVAIPLIGVTSGVIGFSRRIRASKAWLQSCTCWTVVVGYSGTGKTPGLNVTKRVLREIEHLGKESEAKRQREHETRKAKAKAFHKKWEKEVTEATENGTPAPQMPPEAVDPGKYVPLKISVADGTVERLTELLQSRQHGIILLRDELSALFMNMSRYTGGQDNEFWLESWNGDFFNVERMGRNGDIEHLLIGMVGGMQPDKLVRSFEGDHDGQYARVLFAWPDEPVWQGLNNDADEIDADVQNVLSRCVKLAEYADGRLVRLIIPLDAEAAEEFEQFAHFAHREKYLFDGREREWFAKATAHVLRLAGTLTYLEWGLTLDPNKPDAITNATLSAAIILVMNYFWPHARACLRQIGLTEKHANARRALLWIRAKGMHEVSREDIRRDALSQRINADDTMKLMAELCRYGWLREKPYTPSGPGKPAKRWEVNPILFKDPAAEIAEIAEIHS